MRTVTKKYKVYKFDELSLFSKEKAVEKLYDINIDLEWYEADYDFFSERLQKIGLSGSKFYWAMDRSNYFYCDDLLIEDEKKFLKACGIDLRGKQAQQMIEEGGLSHEVNHYGGGTAKNIIDIMFYIEDDGKVDCSKLQDKLDEVMEEFLSTLKKSHEYLTSREAIIETIEANEYDFLADGSQF